MKSESQPLRAEKCFADEATDVCIPDLQQPFLSNMDIRTFSLDPDLTVAEVDAGTPNAWHFLPFEDRHAELFALDGRFILAIGRIGSQSTSVAIFDAVDRRRTNIETNDRLWAHRRQSNASSWCYAPLHQSIFIVESARKPDGTYPNPWQYVRQLSVDGQVNRQILIAPDFSASVLLPREDGRIVCVGSHQVAVLDPVSGEAQVSGTDLIARHHPHLDQGLRWFSPDGRWGLRTHPTSIIGSDKPRMASRFRPFLSRIFPLADAVPVEQDAHPDLEGGAPRFGRALDLFRLDPITFERRLIIRYDELDDEAFATLQRLCDQQNGDGWNARDEWLSGLSQYAPELRWTRWLYDWIDRIQWDDDGQGFTVAWAQGTREVPSPLYGGRMTEKITDFALRHLTLDGVVGSVTLVAGEPRATTPLPSETAIKSIKALVRERSRQVVDSGGWTGGDVAATLRELRSRIDEHGLGALVFGGQLQLRFRVDKRTIGEKKYFETVRDMAAEDLEIVLPELRELLRSYGTAARKLHATYFGSIASGPSDHSPAALSEAALALAMLDDLGFDALRGWIIAVDQEHDYFAANKVFPAMARRTGFATPAALRFGLWFFLQQWQTVKYEKGWLSLFKAAQTVVTPVAFASAVLEEAREVSSFSDSTDVETGISRVRDMLGRTFWDRAATAELDRLLATFKPPPQGH